MLVVVDRVADGKFRYQRFEGRTKTHVAYAATPVSEGTVELLRIKPESLLK